MRILITGAGGMLGRDVTVAAQHASLEPIPLTRADLDVTDAAAVNSAVAEHAPQAVINCAAFTNVDGAEAEETAALLLNGNAAGYLAQAARKQGARMIQVSTDYVFDGTKTSAYLESDEVGPRSAYGRTKLAGEQQVLEADPSALVARTAWLFGVHGNNFVETMLRIGGERGEVAVVTDQIGCPTYTGHLAAALVRLAEHGGPGVHHLAASGHCSWNEFAREIFTLARADVAVNNTTSAEFVRPAPRPAFSVLESERSDAIVLPPWQEGLAAYLAERGATRTAQVG